MKKPYTKPELNTVEQFPCDRCGRIAPTDSLALLYMTFPAPDGVRSASCLCEQCYTTIKEVLEDGEIK